MIVGHSASTDHNRPHAIAWTEKSGVIDLGTLADIGCPAYNSSYASGVNRMGTLIVGWSGVEDSCIGCAPTLPVVWTPSVVWKNGRTVTTWTIHKLDTTGFDAITTWYAWAVNDFGQIVGEGGNDSGAFVGAIWTPLKNGTWKLTKLPAIAGYSISEPLVLRVGCGDFVCAPRSDADNNSSIEWVARICRIALMCASWVRFARWNNFGAF